MTKKLHYLTSSTGLFAIFASYNNGGGTMHYTLKDHQGNLTATIHGNTVERLSYDAWGRRRNPVGFGYATVAEPVEATFDRGYTLHEHYDEFDLINMNGRLYDPVLGRMLSPDIAIQDEHNAQAYNRYSYCFNNPLRFTDPSGYVVTIPPEFDDYYLPQYFDDFEAYKAELAKLGAQKVNYETKELEGGGGTITNLWWNIDDNVYRMIIVDHKLKDYVQTHKNGCNASSLSAQEARFNYGNSELTESFFMDQDEKSYKNGTSITRLRPVLLEKTNVYRKLSYFEFNEDKGTKHYERWAFREMKDDNGVLFSFDPVGRIGHTVNASIAIEFKINGIEKSHEIRIWNSGLEEGRVIGYESFNSNRYDPEKLIRSMGILFIK